MMRVALKLAARIATWCLAAALSTALLTGCGLADGLFAGGSSSTETGDKVALNGRVTGGSGDGLSGVIVSLGGTAIADTTDVTGAYSLSGRRVRTSPDLDTLTFSLNGQTVAKKSVEVLTAVLPELQIVQRGFSGQLTGNKDSITRVEGVVTGDGITPGDSLVATFYFNALSNNYSGFIWFLPATETVLSYTVHINVYGPGGVRTGRSQTVPFNSFAGNIDIPAFNANNLIGASLPHTAPGAAKFSPRSTP